jgi:hypothetical protein
MGLGVLLGSTWDRKEFLSPGEVAAILFTTRGKVDLMGR